MDAGPGGVRLVQCPWFDVYGGADPEQWTYRVSSYGPSNTHTRTVGAGDVLHFRLPGDYQWRGQSPIEDALDSVRLAIGVERSAADEQALPVARLLVRSTNDPVNPLGDGAAAASTEIDDLANRFAQVLASSAAAYGTTSRHYDARRL